MNNNQSLNEGITCDMDANCYCCCEMLKADTSKANTTTMKKKKIAFSSDMNALSSFMEDCRSPETINYKQYKQYMIYIGRCLEQFKQDELDHYCKNAQDTIFDKTLGRYDSVFRKEFMYRLMHSIKQFQYRYCCPCASEIYDIYRKSKEISPKDIDFLRRHPKFWHGTEVSFTTYKAKAMKNCCKALCGSLLRNCFVVAKHMKPETGCADLEYAPVEEYHCLEIPLVMQDIDVYFDKTKNMLYFVYDSIEYCIKRPSGTNYFRVKLKGESYITLFIDVCSSENTLQVMYNYAKKLFDERHTEQFEKYAAMPLPKNWKNLFHKYCAIEFLKLGWTTEPFSLYGVIQDSIKKDLRIITRCSVDPDLALWIYDYMSRVASEAYSLSVTPNWTNDLNNQKYVSTFYPYDFRPYESN